MCKGFHRQISIIVAAAALLIGSTLYAAPFQNGSFEDSATITTIPPRPLFDGYVTLSTGSTDINGWKVTSGTIDYIDSSFWKASDGSRSLDMNGHSAGAIQQTFDTIKDAWYTVTFDLAANPSGPPTVKALDVAATGNAIQSYMFDKTGHSRPDAMGWTQETYTFKATSTSTTLSFSSTTSDPSGENAYGPALDNVSVQVPEPGTIMLLGFGFLGLALQRRKLTA